MQYPFTGLHNTRGVAADFVRTASKNEPHSWPQQTHNMFCWTVSICAQSLPPPEALFALVTTQVVWCGWRAGSGADAPGDSSWYATLLVELCVCHNCCNVSGWGMYIRGGGGEAGRNEGDCTCWKALQHSGTPILAPVKPPCLKKSNPPVKCVRAADQHQSKSKAMSHNHN